MEDTRQCFEEPWLIELRRGLEKLRAGDFGQAETHFSRAHRLAPTRPEICFALGRERLRRGDVDGAENLLRIAWERDPDLLSSAAALARCLGLHRARFAEAHAILDDATRRHPDSPTPFVVRAELLVEQHRAREAMEAANAALARSADDELACGAARAALARAHNLEGARYAAHADLHRALFSFKTAADLDPEWASPLVNIGAALGRLGNGARAIEHYQRALAIDPGCSTAHANLGKAYLEQGHTDRAVRHLGQAVELAPTDADGWVDLANAYRASDAREDAEDCLRQALNLDPQHVPACCRLADLLARDGRYVEAAALAEKAQRIDAARARVS
jgi:tetratricopeptide (TPR) repeat protein